MNYYIRVLQNYFNFEGRDTRTQFWMFVLFNVIISVVLNVLLEPLAGLYSLAVLLPGLGAAARRLHDTGRSGWWQLIGIIPIIGWIIFIIFAAQPSEPKANQYGPQPTPSPAPTV